MRRRLAIGLIFGVAGGAAACADSYGSDDPPPASPVADASADSGDARDGTDTDSGASDADANDVVTPDAGDAGDASDGSDGSAACASGEVRAVTRRPGTAQTLAGLSAGSGGGSISDPSAIAWTTPNRAKTSDDSYAEVTLPSSTKTSQFLVLTNFGFTVPAGATIKGIRFDVERHSASVNTVQDLDVRPLKGGYSLLGTQRASNAFFPTTDATIAFGGATDLWDTTWSAADVNAIGFGMSFAAYFPGASGSDVAYVDDTSITITYRCP